jgi:hypothetical protein
LRRGVTPSHPGSLPGAVDHSLVRRWRCSVGAVCRRTGVDRTKKGAIQSPSDPPRTVLVSTSTVPAVTVVCTPQRPLRKPEQTGQSSTARTTSAATGSVPVWSGDGTMSPLCPDHSAPRRIRQRCPHHYSAVTRNPRFCSLKSRHQSSLVVDFRCYKRPSHSAS